MSTAWDLPRGAASRRGVRHAAPGDEPAADDPRTITVSRMQRRYSVDPNRPGVATLAQSFAAP